LPARAFTRSPEAEAAVDLRDDDQLLKLLQARLKLAEGFMGLSDYATANEAEKKHIDFLVSRSKGHWSAVTEVIDETIRLEEHDRKGPRLVEAGATGKG
jgi:hypothetical protein